MYTEALKETPTISNKKRIFKIMELGVSLSPFFSKIFKELGQKKGKIRFFFKKFLF